MIAKLLPEFNRIYFINQHTLLHILAGSGSIEVDFKNYSNWHEKAIFLEKGQYIKFLSDKFVVRKIEFPEEAIFRNKDVRVLFKHLISLGYIDFNQCEACRKYLSNTIFSGDKSDIIDVSSKQWYWQNPFNASKTEYQIIFDIKDVIDQNYANHITSDALTDLINSRGYTAQALVKDKVGLSVKSLHTKKRLMESKKEIAFTEKSIQEVSYGLGYKDPAYFNRVFKNTTGQSPAQFRKNVDYQNRDSFVQNILELLRTHHTQERTLGFYADKLNLSIKSLSRKVRDKMNTSLGKLIRLELVNSAKELLRQDANLKDISFALGFEEPSHFSNFFKLHEGMSPSEYKIKKYNS